MIRTLPCAGAAALCAALLATLAAPARALEEVPFVTSPDNVTLEMLRIAQVGPKDRLVDLGSGDGRIVIVAAQRFGASGLGVEIVPDLVRRSRESARKAGVAGRAEFREQDIFKTDLSAASVVTMYLLPDVNLALRPRLLALKPGTRIVSHDWDMGDWKPDKSTVLPVPDKKVGLAKTSRVMLWTVPAQVNGLWCGTGLLKGTQFDVRQRYQEFTATMTRGTRVRDYAGRIEGDTLRSLPGAHTKMQIRLQPDGRLVLLDSDGPLALLKGAALARSSAGKCNG